MPDTWFAIDIHSSSFIPVPWGERGGKNRDPRGKEVIYLGLWNRIFWLPEPKYKIFLKFLEEIDNLELTQISDITFTGVMSSKIDFPLEFPETSLNCLKFRILGKNLTALRQFFRKLSQNVWLNLCRWFFLIILIIIFNISIALFTIKDQKRFTLLYIKKKKQNSKSNYRN